MYRRREVEQLLLIRQLLYDRQYTIKGARQYLKELGQRRPRAAGDSVAEAANAIAMLTPAEAGNGVEKEATASGSESAASPGAVTIDGLREELRNILTLLE